MINRVLIKDLKNKVGEGVSICGFVHVIRDQGGIKFLLIRDVTGIIQVVVLKSQKDVFSLVGELSSESVVNVRGLVKSERQAPGGFEIQAESITVLSKADSSLPIPILVEKGGEEPETSLRFDWRWLDLRRPEKQKIFEVWNILEKSFRKYFEENGFTQVYSPSFMTAPSESGADVFEVDYFGGKAYLAQSPQFYKQMAMAAGLERVFMVGPVFRAEPSYTSRHMTEFTGWDFELSYIDSHHDVMSIMENLLSISINEVKVSLGLDVEVPKLPFPKVSMTEAKERLKTAGLIGPKEHDINDEEERKLYELVKKETGSDIFFLIDYPVEARPFYHMRHDDNPKLTKSFDVIYKGLEITTGAQREHRYDVLVSQAKEKGLSFDSIEDYLNFFKYGCPPHGGVGIGPGRIVQQLLSLPSVKEATYLPRDVKRLRP